MPARLLLTLSLCFAAGSCHRSSGPSDAYAKAQELYLKVVQEKGPDAVADPRVDQALSLARQVPVDSIDSESAAALVARIEADRKEYAAAAARRVKEAELVADPQPVRFASPEVPPAAAPAAAPVAGPPAIGSPSEDFLKRYGACVKVESQVLEKGGARHGDAYALTAGPCEEKFPELKGLLVAVIEARVFNVIPQATAQRVAGPAPDAGSPAPR